MQITPLDRLSLDSWGPRPDEDAFDSASETVESGHILHLPRLAFALLPHQTRFLSERWSDGHSKNITLRSGEATLRGASGGEDDLAALRAMLERFAVHSQALIAALFPRYAKQAAPAHVTFRPCAIAGRASSVRKDDSRLHVDAFPANPTGGARILRVFTNLNPDARPRPWPGGGPFADAFTAPAAARRRRRRVESPDTRPKIEASKSYAFPAAEIAGFDYLLTRFTRRHYGTDYRTTLSSVKRNLHSGLVVDN